MKYIAALLLLCLTAGAVQAQEVYTSSGRTLRQVEAKKKKDARGFSRDKIIAGGGLGLAFGDVTNVSIAPRIGYRFTDNFHAGISLGYNYLHVKSFFDTYDINNNHVYNDLNANIYTIGAWARYFVWKNFFAYAAYENNFTSYTDYSQFDPNGSGTIVGQKVNYNVSSVLIGPGIRQPLGEHFAFSFMLVYDLVQNRYSPYYQTIAPIIGAEVTF